MEAGWEEKPLIQERPGQQEAGWPTGGGKAWEMGEEKVSAPSQVEWTHLSSQLSSRGSGLEHLPAPQQMLWQRIDWDA